MEHLEHFGLSQDPFRNDPQLAFYFASPQHTDAERRLVRGVRQGKGLSLIVGDSGCGKTTLVHHLIEGLDEERFEVALIVMVHAGSDSRWLLSCVAHTLGIGDPAETRTALIGQLYERLIEIHEEGRRPVVVIDEAQMLTDPETLTELRGLLNLEHDEKRLLTLVLSGLPELEPLLHGDRPLSERIDIRVELARMDAGSAANYLAHRIQIAGGDPAILTPEAGEAITRLCGGIPRRMNTLADNALFEAFLAGRPAVDAEDVERAAQDLSWARSAEAPVAQAAAPGTAAPPSAPHVVPVTSAPPVAPAPAPEQPAAVQPAVVAPQAPAQPAAAVPSPPLVPAAAPQAPPAPQTPAPVAPPAAATTTPGVAAPPVAAPAPPSTPAVEPAPAPAAPQVPQPVPATPVIPAAPAPPAPASAAPVAPAPAPPVAAPVQAAPPAAVRPPAAPAASPPTPPAASAPAVDALPEVGPPPRFDADNTIPGGTLGEDDLSSVAAEVEAVLGAEPDLGPPLVNPPLRDEGLEPAEAQTAFLADDGDLLLDTNDALDEKPSEDSFSDDSLDDLFVNLVEE